MQLKQIIYITLAALLTACSDELTAPTYTVGEAVNAVTLRAGISEGGNSVQTRAVDGNHAGNANGGDHVPFKISPATQLRLRVDGTWLGKGFSDDLVSKLTTATIGAVTGYENKHNVVSFSNSEQLYWDDYGTADPANMPSVVGNGRDKGLTIYGVAVEGLATAPAVSDWKALSWTLDADQTGGFNKKDLLISNNVTSTADGTYKFDDYVYDLTNDPDRSSNLLEFTHAMSKITVNLVAGEGFPTTGVGATAKKFTAVPEVLLTSNLYGETSKSEWAYTAGTVNVMTGAVSSPNTLDAITTATTKTDDTEFTVIKEALVVPGSAFAENAQVLSILADGNRYYVSSEKMRAAISAAITASKHPDSYTTQPGKNYVFQVTVNKTGIEVTATIKDWENVTAAPVTPIINFSGCYGETGTNFGKGFTLYRSTNVDGSYISGIAEGNSSTVSYNASAYTMSPQLYWPDHQTHYFFRGVWPQVGTAVGPATGNVKANAIDVTNVTYVPGKYPSDLMIGMPRKADGTTDEHCKTTHNVDGICATDAADGATHATEGLIHLNFEYAMSKVEVRLKSSATDASHIDLTKDNTTVEIVGGYNKARIKLSDGLHDTYADADKGNYTLSNLTTAETGFLVTTRDAIVPQEIGNDVIFRITVTNDNGTTDVYQCKVKLINEQGTTTPVTEWAHGKHYIYELDLNKTAINVTATLTDWVEVTAKDNVWF